MNREEFKRKMVEKRIIVSDKKRKTVIDHAVEHESPAINCVICMEELAELQQEISKQLRDEGDILGLLEEMADTYICLELLKKMFKFTDDEIHRAIDIKLDRDIRRSKKDE